MSKDILENCKKRIWPEIQKYLDDAKYPSQFGIPSKYQKEVDIIWTINKDYPERKGKYLRPALLILIAETLGAKRNLITKTAAAMQLSQEWLLIHDDVEDNSEKRRGKPTLHKLYGNELAINAGDMLHIIMWKMIQDTGSKALFEEFYKMILRTALGQGVEQIWTNEKRKLNETEYFFVADGKSGYYSIAGPMRLGAIIGHATPKQINDITEFGFHLGRCFQLIDDLIDLKQDKKEGKSTLINTEGIKFTKKLAKKEEEKAKQIFDKKLKFLSREPARSKLKQLINFILERKY